MNKFKGHFSGPSHPSNPSHPSHQTRASRSPGLRPPRKAYGAGPRRDIVGAWSKIKERKNIPSNQIIILASLDRRLRRRIY